MKAVKSLVLEERAELVASQLTQVIYFLYYFYSNYIFVFFIFVRKSVVESSVYLDFITP